MSQNVKAKNDNNRRQQLVLIAFIVAIVAVVLGVLIFLQSSNTAQISSYEGIPATRTEDGAFVLGNPEARVTIVAFEDFLCGHCQTYSRTTVKPFIEEYVATGQARLEFRMLPISQSSPVLFGMAECADDMEPGSFWQAHDVLFAMASRQNVTPTAFAQEMGLNTGELLECVPEADQFRTDTEFANQFPNVTGTPTVGWRLDGGDLRFDRLPSTQPTVAELAALIAMNAN